MSLRAWLANPDAIWRHPLVAPRWIFWVMVTNVGGLLERLGTRRTDAILRKQRQHNPRYQEAP